MPGSDELREHPGLRRPHRGERMRGAPVPREPVERPLGKATVVKPIRLRYHEPAAFLVLPPGCEVLVLELKPWLARIRWQGCDPHEVAWCNQDSLSGLDPVDTPRGVLRGEPYVERAQTLEPFRPDDPVGGGETAVPRDVGEAHGSKRHGTEHTMTPEPDRVR